MATKTLKEVEADVDEMIAVGTDNSQIERYLSSLGYDPKDMVHADPNYQPTEDQVWMANNIKSGQLKVGETRRTIETAIAIAKESTKRLIPNEMQAKEIVESNAPSITYFKQDPGRLDPIFEVGLPLTAQLIASRYDGGTIATGLIGSAASALGTGMVEARKGIMDESNGWRDAGANITASGISGFAPGGAMAKKAAKASEPFIAGLKATTAATIVESLAGSSAELARSAIAKGEWADAKQVAIGGGVPFVTGMIALPLGITGHRAGERSKEIEQRIATIRDSGGYITPGQAIPSEFSGTEWRMATRDPRLSAAQLYDKSIENLRSKVEQRTAGIKPATEVLTEMSDMFNVPSNYKKDIETFTEAGIKAKQNLDNTEAAMLVAYKTRNLDELAKLKEVRRVFSDEKLIVDFQEAIDYANSVHKAEALTGVAHKTPVEAMQDASAAVIRTRNALVGEGGYFPSRYGAIDKEKTGWAADPIIKEAKSLRETITAGMDDRLINLVDNSLNKLESSGGVSLKNLQDFETVLGDIYKMRPELKSTSSWQATSKLRKKIRQEIDDQAPYVLGKDEAKELRDINKQYHTYKDLEDSPGIDVLMDPKPTGEHIKKMVADLKENGDGSAYYENVMKYINYMGALNPAAGQMHLDQFQRAMRGAIMNDARNASEAMGAEFIDGKKLFQTMSAIDNARPGALRRMGFVNTESIAKLEGVVEKYKDATKLTASDWDRIMKSDAFKNAAPELSSILETGLADNQIRNLITKSALIGGLGKSERASLLYEKAQQTAQKIGADLRVVEQLYDNAMQDPILRALDGGVVDDKDMKKLMNLIMHTEGIDSEWTSEFAKRIEKKNPELVNQIRLWAESDLLQRGYEATAPAFSSMVTDLNVNEIAKASRYNRSAKMEEVWDRVSPFFTKEQRKGIQDIADEAYDKMIYRRRAGIGAPETAKSLGQVGTVGALVRVISNAIDNQRYKWAALNLQLGSGLFDYSHRLKVTKEALTPAVAVHAGIKANQRRMSREELRKATTIDLSKKEPDQNGPAVSSATQEPQVAPQEQEEDEPQLVQFRPPAQ